MNIIRSKSSVEDTENSTETSNRSVEIQGKIGTTSFSFYFEHDGSVDERATIKKVQALMISIGGGLRETRRAAARFLEQDRAIKEACHHAVSDNLKEGFWLYNLKAQMGGISDVRVKVLIEMMSTLGVIEEIAEHHYKAVKDRSQVDLLFAPESAIGSEV